MAVVVADALNVTLSDSTAPAQQLQACVRDKELLLVLDNLEQLKTSAAWLVELLAAAPKLTLLVTSREPLQVRAESVFRLEGLHVPAAEAEGDLRTSEGVQLFIERAARAAGHFTVTAETLQLVAEIGRRVEGMPLALELAAAWARTRTLPEILSAIDASLDFLVTPQGDVSARHTSLRAVWASSWETLTAREQALLAQLTIFQGGFDYPAAQAIINVQQEELDTFIDKSLLKRQPSGRYELHQLLHQFTAEKFARSNQEVFYKYCHYYLHLVSRWGLALQTSEPQPILNQIRAEMANLRAAWQHVIAQAWFELLSPEVVQGIATFYYLTGRFREGITLVEQALAHCAPHEAGSAELELAHAESLERLSRYEEAATELARLRTDPRLDARQHARTQLRVGWVCYWRGKLSEGRAAVHETLQWAHAHGHTALEADALYLAGLIEQSAADTPRAQDLYKHALRLYCANHNRYGESSVLVNLAATAVDNTALDEALQYGQAALTLATQISKHFDQAAANVILGSLYAELGHYSRAKPYYMEALQLFREMGNRTGETIVLCDYARLHLVQSAHRVGICARSDARRARDRLAIPPRSGEHSARRRAVGLARPRTRRSQLPPRAGSVAARRTRTSGPRRLGRPRPHRPRAEGSRGRVGVHERNPRPSRRANIL